MTKKYFNKDDSAQEETLESIARDSSLESPDDISMVAEAEESYEEGLNEASFNEDAQAMIGSLTEDLQRTRADFENYQKRTAQEKLLVRSMAVRDTISKILPIIDIVEQASAHIPESIIDTPFGKGMISLDKKLSKQLKDLGVEKIETEVDDEFSPDIHNAVQVDEDAEGQTEVIADVLQAGYRKDGEVIRYAMVKVTRK